MDKRKKHNLMAIGAILTFVAFFLWGLKAEGAEARLGLGWAYSHNDGAKYQEMMVTNNTRNWYASATRIGGDKKHNYKFWRYCGGYRVNWRKFTNWSPYMRLGACKFNTEPTDYISDTTAYDMAIGIRIYDIVELEIDQHNSTAGRSSQNAGMDAVMFSVIFPFGKE